jgi:hypothetical protein
MEESLFMKLKKDQPKAGDILCSLNGDLIPLSISNKEEGGVRKKAVFCRVAVEVAANGWFLTSSEKGIVCLILPESQKSLQPIGGTFFVSKLKVIRYTANGKSLLCEVIE